jgi:hypothetical protein
MFQENLMIVFQDGRRKEAHPDCQEANQEIQPVRPFKFNAAILDTCSLSCGKIPRTC